MHRCIPTLNTAALALGFLFAQGLTHAHVHVQVGYAAGALELHVLDYDSGRFAAAEYPLFVALAARQRVPADPRFELLLGAPGGLAWILPQNEVEGLLNLGLGTSGIPAGLFAADQIRLTLERMEGPGRFSLFTTSAFGAPTAHMTTADGIDPARDFIVIPAVNGHVHVNWAFTQPGTYLVDFTAVGSLAATGQPLRSLPTRYTFVVEGPEPPTVGSPRILPDSRIELPVEASLGARVRIQSSADLQRWDNIAEATGTGITKPVLLPPSIQPQTYYRAVID
jgi:surface-anchored protein